MKDFNIMLVFDLVIALLGVYLAYAAITMKTKAQVPSAFIPEEEMSRCKDPKGFSAYMWKKTLFFSVICLLCGLASFLFDLKLLPVKKIIGSYLGMGFLILFLIAWMIFNAAMRSGKKDYFSPKPL
ncbi:MAG: hypothetical protein K5889_08990 [Lachnospiraceae bacterium]|nr:hypothetical protein [Lachnospiraceae bacterium]